MKDNNIKQIKIHPPKISSNGWDYLFNNNLLSTALCDYA